MANTDNIKNELCEICRIHEIDPNLLRFYTLKVCTFCLSHACQKCDLIRGEKKGKKGWKIRALAPTLLSRPVCPECVKELCLP